MTRKVTPEADIPKPEPLPELPATGGSYVRNPDGTLTPEKPAIPEKEA